MFAVIIVLGALVASAATAVGAAASEPAFFECAKVTGGEFADKKCTQGGLHGAGKFELVEGIGTKATFSSPPSKWVRLETKAIPMYCKLSAISGEDTSPTTVGHITITLVKCAEAHEVVHGIECTSTGAPHGEVIIGPLSGSLGYIDKATKEVGMELAAEGGGPLSEFGCNESGAAEFQLTGSLFGARTGDINAIGKKFTFLVDAPGAQQNFERGEPAVPKLIVLATHEEQ
ncbi:MAG TPA: hypothetical protein VES97_09235, partial [Solirubrobacteraceae bacterium]|nr:hypothetical protein [Solirubrobacteraceae bacterium]